MQYHGTKIFFGQQRTRRASVGTQKITQNPIKNGLNTIENKHATKHSWHRRKGIKEYSIILFIFI